MTIARALPLLSLILLAACSADPVPGPTEQIIVREPGDAAVETAVAAPEADPALALIAAGKAAFANCSACHAIVADAANGAGPTLYGMIGKPAGAVDGFAYSDALSESGIIWTAAELDAFIANPAAKIPGTTMVAGALAEPEQRRAVIAYIESLSAS
jgi:cytochrome c